MLGIMCLLVRGLSTHHAETALVAAGSNCTSEPHIPTLRVALLFTGDSFRATGQTMEVDTCTSEAEVTQKACSESHVANITRPLEAAGYSVSAYGVTYACSNGRNLSHLLRSWYAPAHLGRFELSIIERSPELYGGQGHAYAAALRMARASATPFDYYIVLRWDLAARMDPSAWRCMLDAAPVARNLAHAGGLTYEAAIGIVNMDWLMVVPQPLVTCFADMLENEYEECCSTAERGSCCNECSDHLNLHFEGAAEQPAQKNCSSQTLASSWFVRGNS